MNQNLYQKLRDKLSEVLAPDLPLYHYTNASGLLGIFTSMELWPTHARFLNDREELLHAHRIIASCLSKRTSQCIVYTSKAWAQIQIPDVYIVSFSSDSNLLSQWRAYGNSYNIGFHPNFLKEGLFFCGGLLRVRYEPDDQTSLIESLIQVTEEFVKTDVRHEPPHQYVSALVTSLFLVAPALKHAGFREEGELRYVVHPDAINAYSIGVDFRVRNNAIVPFARLNLLSSDQSDPRNIFYSVTIGPGGEKALNFEAVRRLMKHKGLENVSIEESDIPFRIN